MPPVLGAVLAIAGNLGISAAALAFGAKALAAIAISAVARKLFAPDVPTGTSLTRDHSVSIREPTAVRQLVYGEVRKGGTIVFIDVTDDNKFLHLIICYAGHRINSYTEHYFDGEALTVSANEVTAPEQYNGKAWVYEHRGLPGQAADADLVAASAQWTTDHRLRGIAYTYYKLQYDPEAYPTGIPNIEAKLKGREVWNPGTGGKEWSDNAVLCANDYLEDSTIGYGLGIPRTAIDQTVLATAQATADESVALLGGGTEARYTCNGVIDLDLTPKAIIEALSSAKGGPTVYNMGKWYLHAGSYKTPSAHFDEDDIVSGVQINTRHSRADLFNQVKGLYLSPDNDWQLSDFPAVTSTTYVTEDDGEAIWRDLSLPFTISAATAQRLALLELNRHRRQITFQATFRLDAMGVIPSDVIQLTLAKFGWTAKTFEVVDWTFVVADDLSLAIGLSLREIDSAVYDWSTADESAANAAVTTNLPDYTIIQAPTGFSVSSQQTPTGSGTDETFQALLEWTAPADEFVVNGGLIQAQFKKSADSTWLPSWFVSGALTEMLIPMLEGDASYDFRIRAYNGIVYSSWQTVSNITIQASGGVVTSQDWGDWTSSPGACGATPSCDWGEWVSSPGTTDDWGAWT